MMTLAITELVMQVLCAIHGAVLRRPRLWRWVVLGVPVVGVLAYVAREIWSAVLRQRHDRAMNPPGAPRSMDGGDAALRAELALAQGETDEAITLYGRAIGQRQGPEPALLLGLARAYFAAGDFGRCLQTLEALRRADPGFEAGQCQALAARCRERLGQRRVA